ncbi:hypothetical protein GWK48_11190 [Metallosphaera tengchongensis]|uniref:Uncharacterized protein n=1 Tax=Metallosphaera tengchongensis TaxID=1532350 RepID=A0A6N0P0G7_9CREN|nr:hypothetical protein [Metallosphaera tengchongensis]QKR00871.1 hypothetical protein GWK48_11190 [Metallosphaera tengchongensis]
MIMDEFQKIRYLRQPFPRILEVMRKRFQESDLVEVIISGSEVSSIAEIELSTNGSLMFTNCLDTKISVCKKYYSSI